MINMSIKYQHMNMIAIGPWLAAVGEAGAPVA